MKISALQMAVQFENADYNYRRAEALINEAAHDQPDVIVLPEMWNVGFYPKDLKNNADANGERTQLFLSKLARKHSVNIVGGSVAIRQNDGFYNTSYIYNRLGECIANYSKIHTFSYMNEDDYFHSGNKVTTFELDGVMCGIVICYDLRFVELIRTLALRGIEVLFIPAQWPDVRIPHWQILNKARAIENQIYSCAVNSVGTAGSVQYGGHSMIIDPWGEILAEEASIKETIINVELDLTKIEQIRQTIHVFNDRRSEIYDII